MTRSRSRFVQLAVLLVAAAWLVWRSSDDERAGGERAALEPVVEVVQRESPAELQLEAQPVAREEAGAVPRVPANAVQCEGEATLVLWLVADEWGRPLGELSLWVSESSEALLEVHEETTDAQGRLTLAVRAGQALAYELETTDPARVGSAHVEVPALAPGERREVVVTLETARDFVWYAQVVDGETRTPLAGARAVRLEDDPFGEPREKPSRPSSAGGLVTLTWHSLTPNYARVELDGYAVAYVKLELGHERPEAACVVPLLRAGALEVFLTDPRGAPRSGLRVRVVPDPFGRVQGDDSLAFNVRAPSFEAFTGADGHDTLEGLPPATRLSIDVLDGNVLLRREPRALPLEPGERRELRWTVGGRCTLLGRALEADGRPAADVVVWLTADDGQRLFPSSDMEDVVGRARSGVDGRFTLDVAAGAWVVFAAPPAFNARTLQRAAEVIAPAAQPVAIAPGQTEAEVTVTCWRGLYLSGTVRDPGGELVPTGMVWVEGRDVYQGTSFSGGAFSLGPLPPGSYRVHASAPGPDGQYASEPRMAEAGTEGIELVLRRSTVLTVRVLGSRGEPVEDAKVCLLSGREYGNRVRTNAKGEAPFENLPRLVFSLTAWSAAGEFALERGVTLGAGTGQRELVLRLEPAPRLRVEVLNAPEEDMQPLILLDGEPLAPMFLDEGPEIPLASGEYEIALWGTQGEAQRKRVRVGAEGVTRVVFDLSAPR